MGKSLQALHTWIWAVYPTLLDRSSQAPSDCMGSVYELPSSGLSADAIWGLTLGFGWATQGHSETCPEATPALSWLYAHGSLLCWKVNCCPSLRLHALWSRFSLMTSLYFAASILPSILTSLPVPAAEKYLHSMMLPPPCFTVGMVLAKWWAVPGVLPNIVLGFLPKELQFLSHQTSDHLFPARMPSESFKQAVHLANFKLKSDFRPSHYTIQA